eukprot:m.58485 g.58485  ORF g.58485 m.58485 type:complete len:467 (+) comp6905_c0_seq1:109-1509(+)
MVDKYERVRVLGSGTYGKAWLVKMKKTGEQFVMKEIKVANKRELDEAKTEAELLSKFAHPNIIKYQEVIQTGSKVVNIVMEYAAGGDLLAKLNRRKMTHQHFTETEVLNWLTQLCEALSLVHAQGMMHRDIKLANMFLTLDDTVKLGDFGIARVLDANAINMSARTCRTPVGTPMYMAPEVCGGSAYGQRADMWAIGCAMYELMTFNPAFNAQSLEGLMHRIKRGRYDENFPPIYSRALQDLVHSLLKVNPQERPSIRDLLHNSLLTPFRQGRAIADSPPTLAVPGQQRARGRLEDLAEESECSGDDSAIERTPPRAEQLKPLRKIPLPPRISEGHTPASNTPLIRPRPHEVPRQEETPMRSIAPIAAEHVRRDLQLDDPWSRDAGLVSRAKPVAQLPALELRGRPGPASRMPSSQLPSVLVVEQDSAHAMHIARKPQSKRPSMLELVDRYNNPRSVMVGAPVRPY